MRAALAALLLLLPAVAACGDDGGSAEGGGPAQVSVQDMPFDPVQGTFIRDTIADTEALEISAGERERIYEGNARELLRMHEHAA